MKIGILTFHRALNYGAVLQCYALQETLKSIGHNVEIIDYRPPCIEKYRQSFSRLTLAQRNVVFAKIKELIVDILLIKKKHRANKAFDTFLNEQLHLSVPFNPLHPNIEQYDVVIVGSDQVWSPTICGGFDPIYWGNFSHEGTKLITYAASIGGHNIISEEMWKQIGLFVRNYTAVSVREQKLYNQLVERFTIPVSKVVDPTILLPESYFIAIAEKPQEEEYVLFFNLDSDVQAASIAIQVAKYYHCKVIALSALQEFKRSPKGIIDKYSVTPQEFLGYFKHAKYIVTSSFHGTVFSVVFRKNFYSLRWKECDRAFDFLKMVGLESRMISKDSNVIPNEVNYTGVDARMAQNRVISGHYLKTVIRP